MLACLLTATVALSPGVRLQTESWSTRDGLPQSSVTSVAQGPDGMLTVGTFGGPARFDGRRFEVEGPTEGLGWSTIRVTAVEVGPDGTRWLGLQDGALVRLDPDGGSEQIEAAPALLGTAVWDVMVHADEVWVASSGGAARYRGGTWTVLPRTDGAFALERDGDATWVGGGFGLMRCDPTCQRVAADPLTSIRDLARDDQGLLAAGGRGLVRVVPGATEVLSTRPVDYVAPAPDGTVWAGFGREVWAVGGEASVTVPGDLRALLVDREQSLWVGMNPGGLARVTVEDWGLVEVGGGVRPFVQRDDGTVWVGRTCRVGGLVELSGAAVPLGSSGCVQSLAAGRDGEVWIGAGAEVWRWTDEHGAKPEADVGNGVLALWPTGRGLWIGTDGGGAFFLDADGGLDPVDVGEDWVHSIAEGPGREMWFGTSAGLSRLDPDGTLKRLTRADGVPAGMIRALHVDGDGTVLMGSYGGGLGVLRDGQLHRLTREHGLPDGVVSAILDDGRGSLWLNGNQGLMRLTRSDLEAWLEDRRRRVPVRRWATPEGNGGGQPAGLVTREGTLLFASVDGVITLDPGSVFHNPVVPMVVVRHAEVDGVMLTPDRVVEVPPGPGRVAVELAVGALRHPELARLEYRLTSPDDRAPTPWEVAGNDRTLVWDALPPGDHVIEVRAANEDGVWSEPTALRFVLARAWHERGVVWGGLALGLVILGLGAHRMRTRAVERRAAALAKEIDQREVAEAALRISEAHYRRVFEGASDALLVLGPDGRVEQSNRASEAMVGRPVVGEKLDDLFGARSEDHGARPVVRDDEELWAALVQLPFEGDRTLARAADVTERVAVEREQRAMSMRLARAERLEAVGRLAGGIAHDFNNLLTAVAGTADLLDHALERDRHAHERRLLDGLRACVDRGARLTRELLAFARRQHLEPTDVDPGALVQGLETILRPSLRDDIVLELDLPRTPVGVYADPHQLELALVNLGLNAQQAMPTGGRVTISVYRLDDGEARERWSDLPAGDAEAWVVLEVADDGHGIPPEDLERVLEPFFTAREDGTGLGLPAVQGFAAQSGGALYLRSAPGRGTQASIVLPWTRPPAPELVKAPPPRTRPVAGRIAVCDDDPMVLDLVVAILEGAGYETIAFRGPGDALASFEDGLSCDALVTDVLMPGMSGPQLAQRVLERRPGLATVFVSGYTRNRIDEDLPGPLITKPFRSQQLLESVADAVTRTKRESAG